MKIPRRDVERYRPPRQTAKGELHDPRHAHLRPRPQHRDARRSSVRKLGRPRPVPEAPPPPGYYAPPPGYGGYPPPPPPRYRYRDVPQRPHGRRGPRVRRDLGATTAARPAVAAGRRSSFTSAAWSRRSSRCSSTSRASCTRSTTTPVERARSRTRCSPSRRSTGSSRHLVDEGRHRRRAHAHYSCPTERVTRRTATRRTRSASCSRAGSRSSTPPTSPSTCSSASCTATTAEAARPTTRSSSA